MGERNFGGAGVRHRGRGRRRGRVPPGAGGAGGFAAAYGIITSLLGSAGGDPILEGPWLYPQEGFSGGDGGDAGTYGVNGGSGYNGEGAGNTGDVGYTASPAIVGTGTLKVGSVIGTNNLGSELV